MIRGLLPLSADPVHFGHINIIQRAAAQCDELVVAVLNSDEKQGHYTFSLPDRLRLVERAIQQAQVMGSVRVLAHEGLLVDLFLKEGCQKVFRGIRDQKDQEYEGHQMRLHNVILPGFTDKVVYLPAESTFRHISSSAIKALVGHHADVSSMCPLFVKSKLERTLQDIYLLGVTGGMGVGKSWVCIQLVAELVSVGVPVCHINIDALLRQLYAEASPGARLVREGIKALTGATITVKNGVADLTDLKVAIAAGQSEHTLRALHTLTEPHVYRLLREAMAGEDGLILIEWARLVEDGMTRLVNNDAIIVTSPNQAAQIQGRGTDPALAQTLMANQMTTEERIKGLRDRYNRDDCGSVIVYDNITTPALNGLAEKVGRLFPGLSKVPMR